MGDCGKKRMGERIENASILVKIQMEKVKRMMRGIDGKEGRKKRESEQCRRDV